MKRILILTVTACVILACISPAAFAQAPKSTYESTMYQVVLAKHGPNWKPQHTEEGMDIRLQAIERIKQAAAEGLIVSAGLVNDETDVEIIMIMNLETKTEALALAQKSPTIQSGFWEVEIYSWFAPKGLAITSAPRTAPKAGN
jgi:uncharacterized protein YciI